MSIIRPFRSLSLLAIVTAAVLAACGSDGPDADTAAPDTATGATGPTATDSSEAAPAGTSAATGETVGVRALDNTFIDETVEVAAGTEVVWKNGGHNEHNIAPVDDSETWGVDIAGFAPGDSYSHVFTEPGEYHYYCTIHGTKDAGMIGTIVVE